ncbi:MAG: hypothetical protein R2746_18420 [Acidimicrobiales bacterium]
MSVDPADRPAPDADLVAGHSFTRSRKGYDADEVRAYLVALASEIREAQRRHEDLERRYAEVERRATATEDLDEAAVTRLLGEEAARVLDAARQAGADIRTRAEEETAALTAAAQAEASSTRAAADAYRDQVREAADSYSAEVRLAADTYASDTRATADTEVAARWAATEAEVAELRSSAETVLADRTAEAEVAATGIRADADAYDARVREDADRHAAETRAAADALRAGAEADVEAVLAQAREEGRAMVQEAREYRERVLADLADRRRAARAHIESLAATRDALSVALTDVVSRVDAAHRSLQSPDLDVGDVADTTSDRRVLADGPPPATSVAVGEVDAQPEADGEVEGEASVEVELDVEPDVEADADEPTQVLEVVEVVEAVVVEAEAQSEPEPEPEPEPADEADAEPEVEAEVEDLFARIRHETEDAVAEPEPEPETGAEAPEAEVADADEAAATVDEPADVDPDTDLLDRRDAATDAIERQLARRLKRVLSDEQNEVLDLLRRTRGNPGAAEVLPSDDDHLARFTQAALEDLQEAERAGAGFFGEAPSRRADVTDTAEQFATELVRQIRVRLERAFDDGGDENEVGDRIRACYREWKTQRISDTARHYVVAAFTRGVVEAAPDGTAFRWLVDDGDVPSPDCEDNALAGPVVKGEAFPTGDLCPPVHPGCRCLVVPVDA